MLPPKHTAGTFQGSLTPITIVVYLAIHAIWLQIVFGPYSFAILRLLFLLSVAILLMWHGHARELRGYFIGRLWPDLSIWQIIVTLISVVSARMFILVLHPGHPDDLSQLWGDCVVASINEELVFRGLFLAILLQYLPGRFILAITISTLIFISIHNLSVHGILSPLLLGVILSVTYVRGKSVPFCMICHALWNVFGFIPFPTNT